MSTHGVVETQRTSAPTDRPECAAVARPARYWRACECVPDDPFRSAIIALTGTSMPCLFAPAQADEPGRGLTVRFEISYLKFISNHHLLRTEND